MALATIYLWHRRESPPIPSGNFPEDLTRAATLRKLMLWGLASYHGIHGYRITPHGEEFVKGLVSVHLVCAAAVDTPLFFEGFQTNIAGALGPRHSLEALMQPIAEIDRQLTETPQ